MALCLFLGCGKSTPPASNARQDTPSAAVPTSAPPASLVDDHRPIIVAFGDSLTAGFGTDPGQSYPDNLQRDLDARGYSYRVVNAGISGNTTKDGVDRLPSVLALHPTIVIVAFGGNDGLRGIPITDSRRNLSTIVQTLLKAHIRVILGGITLPPNYGRITLPSSTRPTRCSRTPTISRCCHFYCKESTACPAPCRQMECTQQHRAINRLPATCYRCYFPCCANNNF